MSIPTKTKSSYPVSLSEAKRHLRVEEDWHDDDDYIDNLIKAATQKAEQYIGKDIAETENVKIMYDYYGSSIVLDEGNFDSFTQAVSDSSTLVDIDHTEIGYNYAEVIFNSSISSDPLTITYKTGFVEGECPVLIKQAILVKIADLYDIDRQSYTVSTYKESKAFESLLDSYKLILF